jgi:hypothetical protein
MFLCAFILGFWAQTPAKPLTSVADLRAVLPAIFDILWFETGFLSAERDFGTLRQYTYTETDTLSYAVKSEKVTATAAPYEVAGLHLLRTRVFPQLKNYESLTKQDRQQQERYLKIRTISRRSSTLK